MATTVHGYTFRDITQHAKPELGNVTVNPAKTLPQTATGNLFTVTGVVLVTGLCGVISTAFGAVANNLNLGIDSVNTAIAANPSAPFNATAAGGVLIPPTTMGGAFPAAVTAQGSAASSLLIVVSNTNITLTASASTTGAVTWILCWAPLYPKKAGSVVAV